MSQTSLSFAQKTEWNGCVLINHTQSNVNVELEYETSDQVVHLVNLLVHANSRAHLPEAIKYKIVHKTSRQALLTFEPWSFHLIAVTDEREFVIRYAYGPEQKVLVSFAAANVKGVKASYADEESMESVEAMVPGETYRFSPMTAKAAVAGKFILRSQDGTYESMIPWSMPTVKNPLYTANLLAPFVI